MLELGRQGTIGGHHGPAIVEQTHIGTTEIDHGFDSKNHARPESQAGTSFAHVTHMRSCMHRASDPMPPVFAHHRTAFTLGELFDRGPDIPKPSPLAHL